MCALTQTNTSFHGFYRQAAISQPVALWAESNHPVRFTLLTAQHTQLAVRFVVAYFSAFSSYFIKFRAIFQQILLCIYFLVVLFHINTVAVRQLQNVSQKAHEDGEDSPLHATGAQHGAGVRRSIQGCHRE